jgi:TM2 domain-containing membrane protein YozV
MRGAPAPQPPLPAPTGKNPALAAVLSVIVPGVGQFYNGDAKKGLIMLFGALILGVMSFGLFYFVIAVWAAIDAYKVANGTGRPW